MGGPPAWGLGGVLTTPHRKNVSCYEPLKEGLGSGLIRWYRQREVAGTCECSNGPWGSTKCGEVLD